MKLWEKREIHIGQHVEFLSLNNDKNMDDCNTKSVSVNIHLKS